MKLSSLLVPYIFFFSLFVQGGQESADQMEWTDRVTQELSDGFVDSDEVRELRVAAKIKNQELSECLQEKNPEECVSARIQPFLTGLASPVSATLSSLIATTVLYPLNLFKMRVQTGLPISSGPYSGFAPYALALGVSRLDYVLYDVLREKGWSIHEAGITSTLALSIPSSPLWVYHTKRSLKASSNEGVSGLKDSQVYNVRCYLRDLKLDPRLAFRGQMMGMVCVIPYAFHFQLMEYIDQNLFLENKDAQEEALSRSSQKAISASMARVALVSVYPLDLLRVNRQSSGLGYFEISQRIWRDQGIRGFYRGAPISILKQVLWTFINRVIYDEMKQNFDQ